MRATHEHQPSIAKLPPATGLVVCERSTKWVAAWRRALGPEVAVAETRTPEDARAAMLDRLHGAVALEIEAQQLPQRVSLLTSWQLEFPHICIVAQVASDLHAWKLLLHEAGAALVLTSPRDVPAAAQTLRKHFARAPRPKLSLRSELWQKLPWSENALLR